MSEFPERCSPVRLVSLPSSGGTGPVRAFASSRSSSSLVRLPSSGGTGPVRAFAFEPQFLEPREVAEFGRDRPREGVRFEPIQFLLAS